MLLVGRHNKILKRDFVFSGYYYGVINNLIIIITIVGFYSIIYNFQFHGHFLYVAKFNLKPFEFVAIFWVLNN
jgi:hypothetical protein